MHTQETTNYQLPIFVATDVPGWLTDFNSAMTSIDSAIKGVDTKAVSAGTAAAGAQGSVAEINQTLVNINNQLTSIQNTLNSIPAWESLTVTYTTGFNGSLTCYINKTLKLLSLYGNIGLSSDSSSETILATINGLNPNTNKRINTGVILRDASATYVDIYNFWISTNGGIYLGSGNITGVAGRTLNFQIMLNISTWGI